MFNHERHIDRREHEDEGMRNDEEAIDDDHDWEMVRTTPQTALEQPEYPADGEEEDQSLSSEDLTEEAA